MLKSVLDIWFSPSIHTAHVPSHSCHEKPPTGSKIVFTGMNTGYISLKDFRALLLQEGWQIAFFSKSLSNTEMKLAKIKLE